MIALISLSAQGSRLAGILAEDLPDSEIHLHDSVDPEIPGKRFERTADLTAQLFDRAEALVFITSTGVAVRSVAPLCRSKLTDPAVVVVDVRGRYAISLLSGHERGANELAVRVGNIIGAEPVVTTTTDALKDIIIGVGCRRGIAAKAVIEAVESAIKEAGVDLDRVRYIASADIKRDEAGLIQAVCELGVPLRFIGSEEIRASNRDFQHSKMAQEKVNLPAVAEPAALLAGRRTSLILPRITRNGVTVAVALENSL
jgi:cobalt-precorrin 5A hydrolase